MLIYIETRNNNIILILNLDKIVKLLLYKKIPKNERRRKKGIYPKTIINYYDIISLLYI
jgi:hypothetical protein